MKIYIIAGEASGDLHASNLVRAMRQQDPGVQLRGWGGDLMQEAGVDIVKHYRDLAFMGFVEVLLNLRTILRNLTRCKEDILAYKPDALILVDYPGFNLRIAEWARGQGIPVHYYISPQIWAWKQNRVHAIKRDVTRMYVVLPFEKEFYARFGMEVEFVGHPLLDAIEGQPAGADSFRSMHGLDERPIVALLPGSRRQEIQSMLPIMVSVIPHFPDVQFVVAGAPSQPASFYRSVLGSEGSSVRVISGATYDLLRHARAGLITSGTATLETGLFNVPQVVCYKGNPISYLIARRLVKVKYISLVNLILDRPAVTELIQDELNTARLKEELKGLLEDGQRRDRCLDDYRELHQLLGGPGASTRVASLVLKSLKD